MQIISSDALNLLRSDKYIDVTVNVSPVIGDAFTLTNSDIILGSFSIDRNSISSENIEIGNSESTEVKFSLNNMGGSFNQKFEGAELYIVLSLNSENIPAGYFIVDQVDKGDDIITITALDNMSRFNRIYVNNVGETGTLFQILNQACVDCGVTLYDLTFTNSTLSVNVPVADGQLTYHEVVSYIAEMAGSNAYIYSDGQLHLNWYGETSSSPLNINASDRFSHSDSETETSITGIVCDIGEESFEIGTTEYAISIINNPFITEDNVNSVLNTIYSKISTLSFVAFDFTVHGFPHVWPMDELLVTDPYGRVYTTYVMKHNYVLNGNSKLSSKGKSEVEAGYASIAPFTDRQRQIINVTSSQISNDVASNYQLSMFEFNKLMTNSLGYYESFETGIDGAIIRYIHDAPTKEASTNIYKQTADGFAFTNDGWNDGSPVWQTGMTADGNIIGKVLSVVGINADWINAGTIDANEVNIINLDVQNVTIGSSTTFEAGYDPSDKADKSTPVTVGGKAGTIKLNTTDGLAFFDGATYRGGLGVRGGDLTLLTDIIGTPDNLYHYAKFDHHNPYGTGAEFSILRFFSRIGTTAASDDFLDISGRVNAANNAQVYLANNNLEARMDLTTGSAPYETSIGSAWIQLNRSSSAKKAHVWMQAINEYEQDASIRLWSQSNPYIEFMVDKSEVGRFNSSGLTVKAFTRLTSWANQIDGKAFVWHIHLDGTNAILGYTNASGSRTVTTLNHSHPYAASSHTHSNISITAGNGLSGGGTLAATRTLTLGTPSTLTASTTNAVASASHTHAISGYLENKNDSWISDAQGNPRFYLGVSTNTTNQTIFRASNAAGTFQWRNSANSTVASLNYANGALSVGAITESGTALSSKYAPKSHSHSYVPTSRTVNGKALSSNITLTGYDIQTTTTGTSGTLAANGTASVSSSYDRTFAPNWYAGTNIYVSVNASTNSSSGTATRSSFKSSSSSSYSYAFRYRYQYS